MGLLRATGSDTDTSWPFLRECHDKVWQAFAHREYDTIDDLCGLVDAWEGLAQKAVGAHVTFDPALTASERYA